MPATGAWNKNYPNGCISPEHRGDRFAKPHKASGLCTTCSGREYARRRKMRDDEAMDGETTLPADVGDGPPDIEGAAIPDQVAEATSPYEQVPGSGATFGSPSQGAPPPGGPARMGKPSLRDRFRRKEKPPPTDTYEAPKTTEKRPGKGRTGRRVSGAETISDAWSGIGGQMVRMGKVPATGRMLQFQAPVAGEMVDEAIKGSLPDRVILQPIVRARSRFDLIGAVFGPPLIVAAIERDPAKVDILLPMLRSSIRASLPLMVPAIKRVKAREKAAEEAAAELFKDDPDFDPNVDPVEQIIASIFGGLIPSAPSEQMTDEPVETTAMEVVP